MDPHGPARFVFPCTCLSRRSQPAPRDTASPSYTVSPPGTTRSQGSHARWFWPCPELIQCAQLAAEQGQLQRFPLLPRVRSSLVLVSLGSMCPAFHSRLTVWRGGEFLQGHEPPSHLPFVISPISLTFQAGQPAFSKSAHVGECVQTPISQMRKSSLRAGGGPCGPRRSPTQPCPDHTIAPMPTVLRGHSPTFLCF